MLYAPSRAPSRAPSMYLTWGTKTTPAGLESHKKQVYLKCPVSGAIVEDTVICTPSTSGVSLCVGDIVQNVPNGKVTDILLGPDRKDSLILPGGEDPPPEFAPYEAEYEVNDDGDVSHDPHLNEDGEVLYRFLLSQAQPPAYILRMSGTHTEIRTRRVQRTDSDGHTHWHTETYTQTVLDFVFAIDLAQYVVAGPVHWSVPDEVPTYRGEMFEEEHAKPVVGQEVVGQGGQARGKKGKSRDLEIGVVDGRMRKKAEDAEVEAAEAWEQTRIAKGFPPWVGHDASLDAIEVSPRATLKSSRTVREWADEYCSSNKVLKEFMFEKIIYGWDTATLSAAFTTAIRATPYTGNISVSFECPARRRVYVRPDNTLSRVLDSFCYKLLLWLVLVYPFIWLWRRFSRRGGGRWEAAYALKRWRALPAYEERVNAAEGMSSASESATEIVGLREGEFFQRWEGTIKRGVAARWQLDSPLRRIRSQQP